jgi:hypothetical protein
MTHQTTLRVSHYVVLGIHLRRLAVLPWLAGSRISIGQEGTQHADHAWVPRPNSKLGIKITIAFFETRMVIYSFQRFVPRSSRGTQSEVCAKLDRYAFSSSNTKASGPQTTRNHLCFRILFDDVAGDVEEPLDPHLIWRGGWLQPQYCESSPLQFAKCEAARRSRCSRSP